MARRYVLFIWITCFPLISREEPPPQSRQILSLSPYPLSSHPLPLHRIHKHSLKPEKMPLIKGKMRQEEDSDSDESFHCCGRPEDLVEDWRSSMEAPKPDGNEVHVPDEQEYYLYSAGLDRLKSPGNGPSRGSCSSIHAIPRCSTVYSS
ncbi:hypothetical protein PTTG_06784, partial [Puccinia triticina 1-1 BBBD Race 1]